MNLCGRHVTMLCVSIGIATFVTAAILGWIKLQYGFSIIDEGMYMVDGWRLTVGDRLFPDSGTSVSMLYVLFNALVFYVVPDITLLQFRQLQYLLTLVAILAICWGSYRWLPHRSYLAPILASLSVFAFTGLDPVGLAANLSYYTYPHFFFTLHIAFTLAALIRSGWRRQLLLVASGLALWAIGFSLLPLSVTMVSPILLWLLARNGMTGPRFF